ncbi:MAG: hypothetical protein WCH65_02475 [bacterium]
MFNGNCIALVGTDGTKFSKNSAILIPSMIYANNKRNIIIDNIKINASTMYGNPIQTAIKFDGATNNSTINAAQVYNTSLYGIYLGQ